MCFAQGINLVGLQIFLLLRLKLLSRQEKYISNIRSFIPEASVFLFKPLYKLIYFIMWQAGVYHF